MHELWSPSRLRPMRLLRRAETRRTGEPHALRPSPPSVAGWTPERTPSAGSARGGAGSCTSGSGPGTTPRGRGSAPRPCRAPDGAPARGPLSGRPRAGRSRILRRRGVSPHRVGRTRGAVEAPRRGGAAVQHPSTASSTSSPSSGPRRSPVTSSLVARSGGGPGSSTSRMSLLGSAGSSAFRAWPFARPWRAPSTATTTPLAWSEVPPIRRSPSPTQRNQGAPLSSGATSAAAGRRALSG